jgi:hypothetical protein
MLLLRADYQGTFCSCRFKTMNQDYSHLDGSKDICSLSKAGTLLPCRVWLARISTHFREQLPQLASRSRESIGNLSDQSATLRKSPCFRVKSKQSPAVPEILLLGLTLQTWWTPKCYDLQSFEVVDTYLVCNTARSTEEQLWFRLHPHQNASFDSLLLLCILFHRDQSTFSPTARSETQAICIQRLVLRSAQ